MMSKHDTQLVDGQCKSLWEAWSPHSTHTLLLHLRESHVNGESRLLMERGSFSMSLTWISPWLKTARVTFSRSETDIGLNLHFWVSLLHQSSSQSHCCLVSLPTSFSLSNVISRETWDLCSGSIFVHFPWKSLDLCNRNFCKVSVL